ncbi:hypothetical protein F4808DRAFT_192208 [Astrocystis sublimbata]|nr:hypothetical protein F4808DRAFT_192208 [Astrocystis sublimbata]
MSSTVATPQPPAINYVVGFLLVGVAWGLTTPFIRRAAKTHNPPSHPLLSRQDVESSWLKSKLFGAFFAVVDLLRNPRYAVPLLINLTGSVWFFLLIGQAELSLTVPIVNTLAFLFTVLGDWWVDKKVIDRGESHDLFKSITFTDQERHMGWDAIVFGWHRLVCTEQVMIIELFCYSGHELQEGSFAFLSLLL